MSLSEILWRVQSLLRDQSDRVWLEGRARRILRRNLPASAESGPVGGFVLHAAPPGEWARGSAAQQLWAQRLVARAAPLAERRIPIFDLQPYDYGRRIDWNLDPKSGRRPPRGLSSNIDYRDFATSGDAKFVWEPNRHQHFYVLARAYRASGDETFARAVVEQWESWFEQCPFGHGMNWRSPLELAVRLINWVATLDLLAPSGHVQGYFRTRVVESALLHLWDITRKYSRGSSANNHLVGEAAGVYVAATYFAQFPQSDRWRRQALGILGAQLAAQTFPDGVNRELATGYHVFCLQFFTLAARVARRVGDKLPSAYGEKLARMFDYVAALREGGELPLLGDADDGYVLDIGRDPFDLESWLAVGASLLNRPELGSAGEPAEGPHWLLETPVATVTRSSEGPLRSRAFADAGHYLLQYGERGSAGRISVLADCGPHGFGAIAAHAHADALSITLRVGGHDVLVDPGTYDYFSFPAWREHLRRTRAHNTVEVDGRDQSELRGPFLWGRRANVQVTEWLPTETGGRLTAEHDGYATLPDPVNHRRTLILDGPTRTLIVRDELAARGPHDVVVAFQFAEECRLAERAAHGLSIEFAGGRISVELDPRLSYELVSGVESPPGGWVSRGYHRRNPALLLLARTRIPRTTTLECRFVLPAAADKKLVRVATATLSHSY